MDAIAALAKFGVDGHHDGLAAERPAPDPGVDVAMRVVGELDRQLRAFERVVEPNDQPSDVATDVHHHRPPFGGRFVGVGDAVSVGVFVSVHRAHGAPTFSGTTS